jgi:4-diphosphocytidyl-2-C-methyl-D-erythritol kinase
MSLTALYDVPAPAKLNLFLHVIGQRADGYHLLQSPFVLIDWADNLHFELRRDGRMLRHDIGPALPADDLCLRAARALQTASGTTLGADISIDKRVPWGAGLGGGSSDAASTLLALNRLWNLRLPRERLAGIALQLGADVPFFVGGDNAFVEGIGEKLTPLRCPVMGFAVVKPAASLATREIFQHPAMVRDSIPVIVEGYLSGTDTEHLPPDWQRGFGRNDLQAAAEDRCVDVAKAAAFLKSKFGNSRMTGSGSAVFSRWEWFAGSSGSPSATFPVEELLQDLPPGWVGRMCHSLVQHPLRSWAD